MKVFLGVLVLIFCVIVMAKLFKISMGIIVFLFQALVVAGIIGMIIEML